MNLIKFFIVFTLLAIAGGGCKSSTSEVSGITKIKMVAHWENFSFRWMISGKL